jgi:hypothetical protein
LIIAAVVVAVHQQLQTMSVQQEPHHSVAGLEAKQQLEVLEPQTVAAVVAVVRITPLILLVATAAPVS